MIFGPGSTKKFELIYKASVHGFKGSAFHERCDKLGSPTICFVLSETGNVFGGYVSIDWDGSLRDIDFNNGLGRLSGLREDNNAFIFSLTHKTMHN